MAETTTGWSGLEVNMGYGGPIGLIVVGLILGLAVDRSIVGPVDVATVGWILVLAGALWLALTLTQQNTRRSRRTVATTTDAEGRQATTERRTETDPPAPPAV